MSKKFIHNGKEFIHGSIYKITLENFMTYSNVEFFPGQSLNLIIGPNGSGKSSIINAIILGLGGNLSDISKTRKISHFIKRGTQEAKIEIELYQNGKPNTFIITTILSRSQKNLLYQKNHKSITKQDLLNCVSKCGIQVSNLCQVLPQLRVQEFSEMNSQQLLVNTISAVTDFNGIKVRKDLIDKSTELKNLEQENQNLEKDVKRLQKLNTRDESKVRDVEDQTKLRREKKWCEMKENWLRYKKLENDVEDYKKEMESENKVIEDLERKKTEKVKEKEDIAKKKSCHEKSLNFIKTEIGLLKEAINNKKNSIMRDARKFKVIEDSVKQKGRENLNRDNELNYLSDKLKDFQLDLSNFENEHGNESSLLKQYKEKDEFIKKLHQQRDELEREILSLESDKEIITNSINTCEQDLKKLNEKYDTMVLLEQRYSDTYRALKWLDENRSLFQHRVYNPILLEIDLENEEDAKYLENTVSNKDLTAFYFEDTQDMEMFLKKVRLELGYKQVNACKVSEESILEPPPIDEIRRFGLSRYMRRLHHVPPGDADVPAHLQLYFTDKHKVSVKKSAYSGLQLKYTTFISPPKLLKSYKAPIKSIEENLNNLVNDKNDKTEKLKSLKSDRDNLNSKIKIEKESHDEIRKKIEKLNEITKNIEDNRRLYEKESEIGKVDMEVEKARARQQQADITQNLVKKQSELLQDVRRLHAAELYSGKLKQRFEDFEKEYIECEKGVKELEINLNDQKKKTDAVKSKMNACKLDMDIIKDTIRDPENNLPSDPGFLYKVEFSELPEVPEELMSKSRRIARDRKFNEDYSQYSPIMEEYKKRVKEIKEKNTKIEESKVKIQQLKNIIAEREPRWLSELGDLVETINESFKDMFESLGYKGEVLLDTDHDDISKYGINIMVSFSARAPARLDAARQSGGERAAATACYLLALQAAAAAPFRCLDEINQGMDAKNERNFVRILMDVSSEDNHCQYFVLSPKLLKNLEYNNTVKVHVIMSGESNVSSNVWDTDMFMQKARDYGKNNSDVDE